MKKIKIIGAYIFSRTGPRYFLGPLASKANILTLLAEKSPRTKLGVYKLKTLCYNIIKGSK